MSDAPAEPRRALGRRLPPWAGFLALAVAAFIALSAWALASPPGSSPDEDFHLASIWCGQGERAGVCEPGTDASTARVPAAIANAAICVKDDPSQSAACVLGSSMTELVPTTRFNANENPPVYYWLHSLFVGSSLTVSVLAMRLLNVVIFLTAIAITAIAVGPSLRRVVLLSAAASSVPLGVYLIPSLNPSSWAVIAALIVWPSAFAFLRSEQRRRSIALALLVAFGTALALGSRADSAVFAAMSIGIGAVLAFDRARIAWLKLGYLALLAVVCAASYKIRADSVDGLLGYSPSPDFVWYADPSLWFNLVNLPDLWAGNFGTWGLGWFDVAMPHAVPVLSWGVYAALVMLGLQRSSWRKLLVLLGIGGLMVALPIYALAQIQALVGGYVQPRYFLPLLIIALAIALFDEHEPVSVSLPQLTLIVGALSVANAVALHATLRRYVSGTNVVSPNLSDGASWWWPGLSHFWSGPNAVALVGALAFAAAVALAFLASRPSLSQPSQARSLDAVDSTP